MLGLENRPESVVRSLFWILAISHGLSGCNGSQPRWPNLEAEPITMSSAQRGETFRATVVAEPGWEVISEIGRAHV